MDEDQEESTKPKRKKHKPGDGEDRKEEKPAKASKKREAPREDEPVEKKSDSKKRSKKDESEAESYENFGDKPQNDFESPPKMKGSEKEKLKSSPFKLASKASKRAMAEASKNDNGKKEKGKKDKGKNDKVKRQLFPGTEVESTRAEAGSPERKKSKEEKLKDVMETMLQVRWVWGQGE